MTDIHDTNSLLHVIHQIRATKNKGGGVAMFIHDSLSYNLKNGSMYE